MSGQKKDWVLLGSYSTKREGSARADALARGGTTAEIIGGEMWTGKPPKGRRGKGETERAAQD